MGSGGAITGLSVVAGSSDALYVLYDAAAGARRNVGLLVLQGASSGQIQVNTFNVGEGSVGRRALVLQGATLVGAFRRPNGAVVAFTRPASGGAVTEIAADPSLTATSAPSVATSGSNVLISWVGSNGATHLWTLRASGQPAGVARTVTTNFTTAEATGALGGAVIGVVGGADAARLSVTAGRAPRAIGAAPSGVTAFATMAAGRSAVIVSVAGGEARATLVRSLTDRGRSTSLGPAVSATHAAVSPTPWGAFALWPSAQTLNLRALRADGRTLGPSFAMGAFRATQPEAFSVASTGNVAFAFWAEGGNIQMLRMQCFS